MFGNDDKKDEAKKDESSEQIAEAVQAMTNNTTDANSESTPTPGAVSEPSDPGTQTDTTTSDPTPVADTPASDNSAPTVLPSTVPESTPSITTSPSATAAEASASTDAASPSSPAPAPGGAQGDLLDIKQHALEQLRPLVDHLDSVPEEKFDALMMMIRASDDQSLIEPAYETAQKITDDKKRAEALLDVVNEINYLTNAHQ